MTSNPSLQIKTLALILAMVIFNPVGDVFLSTGMKRVGAVSLHSWTPGGLYSLFAHTFGSYLIWAGVLCLLLFFTAYLLTLSWADYSYVQPATAAGYALIAVLGHFILHEPVSWLRWVGVGVICLGVLLVGQTPPRTTRRKAGPLQSGTLQ